MALVERLQYVVDSDTARAQGDLKRLGSTATESMSKLDRLKGAASLGLGIGAGASAATGLIDVALKFGDQLTKQFNASVDAASRLEQSAGAVKAIFGSAAGEVTKFGRDAAEAVGLSSAEFQQQAAVIGALLQNLGRTREEAASTSVELVKIGADLSATFGGNTADAVAAISSALRGERDPIERYGVSIKQAAIDQEVLRQGLDTSTAALKTQAEATAALSLIREQAAASTGAFARESDTLAGQQQRFNAELENARAQLGEQLLPAMTDLVKVSRDLIPVLGLVAGAIRDIAEAAQTAYKPVGLLLDNVGNIPLVGSKLAQIFDGGDASIVDFGKTVEDAFDALRDGTRTVDDFLPAFKSMPPAIQEAINKLLGLGPAADDAGSKLKNLAEVSKGFGSIGTALFGAERAQTAFTKSLETGGSAGVSAASRAKAYESALRRIDDATRNVADAQRDLQETEIQRFLVSLGASSDDIAEAQINERNSTRSLAESKLRLIDAQQALNRLQNGGAAASRLEAQAAFLEAQKGLADAEQAGDPSGLLRARAALIKAQQGLDDTSSAKQSQDLARAKDAVAAAEDGVTQSAIDQRKAQRELNDTLMRGKEGSKELRDADRDLEDARRRLEDATRSLDDAQDGLIDAMNQTSAATKTASERFDSGVKSADSWIQYLIENKATPEEFAKAIGEISTGLSGVAAEAGKLDDLQRYNDELARFLALYAESGGFGSKVLSGPMPKGTGFMGAIGDAINSVTSKIFLTANLNIDGRQVLSSVLAANDAAGQPLVTRR